VKSTEARIVLPRGKYLDAIRDYGPIASTPQSQTAVMLPLDQTGARPAPTMAWSPPSGLPSPQKFTRYSPDRV
jgi:hypothetical protein